MTITCLVGATARPAPQRFIGASEDQVRDIHGIAPAAELGGAEIGFLVAKGAEIKRQK